MVFPGAVVGTATLTMRYPGPVTALDGLTVSIPPGITGLVGANGAGKSTLIKLLLGLLRASSGQATVLGYDCRTQGERIRSVVGYMPESDCLPPEVTATEFVTHMGRMSGLPATAAKERAAESLRHVGLHEERYRLVGTYSTGMKQRVKLAQALVADPRLLLLDEPTNGLDPAGRDAMLELIERVGTEFGISIVVASHLLGEVEQICGHLVAIEAGRLLRSEAVTALTKTSQVLLVEVGEDLGTLAAELAMRGLKSRAQDRGLLVQADSEEACEAVVDSIAKLGLPLLRLQQRRHRLEELFSDQQETAERPGTGGGAKEAAHAD